MATHEDTARYRHRRALSDLQQARHDLGRARFEFERVSTALNSAVSEANRWHDSYEQLLAENHEARTERAEQRVSELEEEIEVVEAERDQWRSIAEQCAGQIDELQRGVEGYRQLAKDEMRAAAKLQQLVDSHVVQGRP